MHVCSYSNSVVGNYPSTSHEWDLIVLIVKLESCFLFFSLSSGPELYVPIKKTFLSHPTLFYCFSVLMQYVFAYIHVNRVHLSRDVLLSDQTICLSGNQTGKEKNNSTFLFGSGLF